MTKSLFYYEAFERAAKTKERHGQALFNHLLEVRPDLAERVRGTDNDPFYARPSDPNWNRFFTFLDNHWETHPIAE